MRVKRGDSDAFGALVDRHKDVLVNYLTRLARDRDRAEELAQEAFLRLYQKSSYYRERGQLLPYLMRIATNLLRSEQRRATRWRALAGRVAHERPAPPA
ncbi:MAG: sigma factor, partial [Thermoanaerobaculia bacterium]|nr:sigma factor [Thermoanaerobaculia bacterium]